MHARTPDSPQECHVVNGRSFRVVGVAVTAAARPYPGACFAPSCHWFAEAMEDARREARRRRSRAGRCGRRRALRGDPVEPGLVWLTEADARGLAAAEDTMSYVVNLKLADPTAAPAFVDAHLVADGPGPQPDPGVVAAHPRRGTTRWCRTSRTSCVIGSRLLALLAVASVAVLVGGRMADQTRRVGLLKAVGGTPRLVAAVLLAEYVVVALLAAAAGLAAGWLAAPLLTDPGAGLLGSAGAPSLTLSTVAHGHGRGARGRGGRDLRARRPRRPHQHRPRPGRRGPPTPAHPLADRDLGRACPSPCSSGCGWPPAGPAALC